MDLCKDDACVGIIHDERRSPELYYFDESDRTPQPLDLDVQGYLTLLPFTLGFLNWQSLLRELASPAGQARPYQLLPDSYASTIRSTLPLVAQLVPGWSLEAFVACYDAVKLSAQPGRAAAA